MPWAEVAEERLTAHGAHVDDLIDSTGPSGQHGVLTEFLLGGGDEPIVDVDIFLRAHPRRWSCERQPTMAKLDA